MRSELVALSDNYMGRVLTYSSGRGESVRVYAGPDLYDALEDLDTTSEVVSAAGRRFTLYSTLLAPELLIAILDVERLGDERFRAPCEDSGVLSKHLSRRSMIALLHELRIEERNVESSPPSR